ncbi:MAG: glycosyltransferase [Candidatus Binataceae bacterium]|nr:glycosyltransferase [Candidatus Binataceae bacterium]
MSVSKSQAGGTGGEPDRRLRIVGIDPELRFAGGEVQVLSLTRELIRRGHQAELLCDPRGGLFRSAREAGITCHPLAIRNSIDIRAGLQLRRFLAGGDYDVVHFHTSRAHSMAPYAHGRASCAVVTRRMDYRPNRLFARWLYHRAVDRVVAISPGVAQSLIAAGVARSRITIIPSGIDPDRFRPPTAAERQAARNKLGLASGQIAIGAAGALEPRKGHRVLLQAMAAMQAERDHEARCFIAGEGTLGQTLIDEAARLHLDGIVHFIGQLKDTRELLWALDIFAMPSLKEGLGVAILEAMGCGLAIAASNVGGAGDAIANGCGLAIEPGNAAALAAALRKLIGSSEQRLALGEAARRGVIDRFTIAASTAATLKLYFNCVKDRRRGSVSACGA